MPARLILITACLKFNPKSVTLVHCPLLVLSVIRFYKECKHRFECFTGFYFLKKAVEAVKCKLLTVCSRDRM